MQVTKNADGTLTIPLRAEHDGVIGDGSMKIGPDHPEYALWLQDVTHDHEGHDIAKHRLKASGYHAVRASLAQTYEGLGLAAPEVSDEDIDLVVGELHAGHHAPVPKRSRPKTK